MTTPPLPASPLAARRSKLFAITAMSLAAIGLALAVLPSASLYAVAALLSALTLAIIALVKKSAGGKGLSVAAIATATAGFIVAFAMVVSSTAATAQAVRTAENAAIEQPDAAAEPPFERGATSAGTQELALIEAGFGRITSSPGEWWFVLVLESSRAGSLLLDVPITTEAQDAYGNVLASSVDRLTAVPGRNAITGKLSSPDGTDIIDLSVNVPLPTLSISNGDQNYHLFETSNIVAEPDERGATTVRGDITNIYKDDLGDAEIIAIARDGKGRIISVATGVVGALSAGSTAQFEAEFPQLLPEGTTYEAFAE